MKKTIMILLGLSSVGVFANNSEIKVNAKINAGCIFSASDISFGQIYKDEQETDAAFLVNCSKGTTFVLEGNSKNNYNGEGGAILFKSGETTKKEGKFLHYALKTHLVTSTSDYTILKVPSLNSLFINYGVEHHNYTMQIKVLSQNSISLPFKGRIEMDYHGHNLQNVENGVYTDDYTYTLTF